MWGRMTVWSGDLNFDTENKTRLRKLVKTQWTLTEKWKVPRVQEFHILCKYSPHLLYMNQACHVILLRMVFYWLPFCRIFFCSCEIKHWQNQFLQRSILASPWQQEKSYIFWRFSTYANNSFSLISLHVIDIFYWITTYYTGASECMLVWWALP